jgi:hypothetical protein
MIKLILEITQKNLFKYRKSERSPQKSLGISCQSVLIPRKISGTFYAKSCEKHREFFTREGVEKLLEILYISN